MGMGAPHGRRKVARSCMVRVLLLCSTHKIQWCAHVQNTGSPCHGGHSSRDSTVRACTQSAGSSAG